MDGLLVIDKPTGPTSHDVVARIRRLTGERRAGHTGTLDPAASGVLPIVLGRATRLARFLSAGNKLYEATVRLGVMTDTYDAQGVPVGLPHGGPTPSREAIEQALDAFRGTFLQQPPQYSAKKVDGRRSYRIARAHARQMVRLKPDTTDAFPAPPAAPAPSPLPAPARVTANAIAIVAVEGDVVTLRVDCSAGFYVRALAHDLGQRLGVGGHLAALRRTESGGVTISEAWPLDVIERDPARAIQAIVPMAQMLAGLSAVVLTGEGVQRARHGRELGPSDAPRGLPHPCSPFVRLLDQAGALVGIGEPSATSGLLHPSVVLV